MSKDIEYIDPQQGPIYTREKTEQERLLWTTKEDIKTLQAEILGLKEGQGYWIAEVEDPTNDRRPNKLRTAYRDKHDATKQAQGLERADGIQRTVYRYVRVL